MRVVKVDAQSSLLGAVVALGDQHKEHLGFFPAKAFKRSAILGRILAAVDDEEKLQGYLLYYVGHSRAVIQHLCVGSECRGQGTARSLVDHLKTVTSHCDGIALHCRRDFPAHSLWRKLGFHAVGEKPGRGKGDTTLTRFWLDYGHPDLMSAMEEAFAKSRHMVVLDANVFFDLRHTTRPKAEESRGLQADWLQDSVALCVTDEIFNEIDRNPDAGERNRAKAFARRFLKLRADSRRKERISLELCRLLPEATSEQDRSDRRQLAAAIAGDAPFFVTCDGDLLRHGESVRSRFGICVLEPADLIVRFDELLRQAEYEPARFAGTIIQERKIRADDIDDLAATFVDCASGERKREFDRMVRRALSDPRRHDSLLVQDPDGRMLALVVLETAEKSIFVPVFRIAGGPLAGTLARKLALRVVADSIRRECRISVVTDAHLPAMVGEGLREIGFTFFDGRWAKVHLTGVGSPGCLADQVRAIAHDVPSLGRLLTGVAGDIRRLADGSAAPENVAQVEKRIWPGKVDSSALSSFIVPIQPRWAQHLFDEGLANQTLFGAVPPLALNCEHVYYRGSRPRVLRAPGRILWYVSSDAGLERTKAIRACSTLDEIVIGKAKELYQRFQRLGVFEWNDVKGIAHGDANGEVMAVRFGLTEQFGEPIDRSRLCTMLESQGRRMPPLSTPYAVSADCFRDIYRLGMGITDKH